MTECEECKHYYEELDTNIQECKLDDSMEIKDEWWGGKEDCPHFDSRYEEYEE